MVLGIISAMSEELELLLKEMDIERTDKKANMQFNYGTLWSKKVVAVVCGIGKVNAAVCTQILISEYKANKIVNVGVAGGIGEEIVPGDLVIANNLVQHDMDTTAFGDKHGQVPRLDTFDFKCDEELVSLAKNVCANITKHKSFVGRIVTGDQFVANVNKIRWFHEEFNALACEMEGGSIAHVCYLNHVPFVVIRSISDNANTGAHMDYEKFIPIAVENSTNILRDMVLAMK